MVKFFPRAEYGYRHGRRYCYSLARTPALVSECTARKRRQIYRYPDSWRVRDMAAIRQLNARHS